MKKVFSIPFVFCLFIAFAFHSCRNGSHPPYNTFEGGDTITSSSTESHVQPNPISRMDSLRKIWYGQLDSMVNEPSHVKRIHIYDSLLANASIIYENDLEMRALVWRYKAFSLRKLSRFEESLSTYDTAQVFYEMARLPNQVANNMYMKSLVFFQLDKNDEGFTLTKKGVAKILNTTAPDTAILLKICCFMATQYADMQNVDSAVVYQNYCERYFFHPERLPLRIQHGTYNNLSTVYEYTGRYDKAMAYLNKAIKCSEELGDDLQILESEYNLANLKNIVGDYEGAISILRKYISKYSKMDSAAADQLTKQEMSRELADEHDLIGHCFVYLKDMDSSAAHFYKAVSYGRIGYPENSFDMVVLLSSVSEYHRLLTHDWDSVLIYQNRMKHALPPADERYTWLISTQYLPNCALAYACLGNEQKANELIQESLNDIYKKQQRFKWEDDVDPMTSLTSLDILSSSYKALYDRFGNPNYTRKSLELIDEIHRGEEFIIARTDDQNLLRLLDNKADLNGREIGLLSKLSGKDDSLVQARLVRTFEEHKSTLLKKYFQQRRFAGENQKPVFSELGRLKTERTLLTKQNPLEAPAGSDLKKQYYAVNFKIDSLVEVINKEVLLQKIENSSTLDKKDFVKAAGDRGAILDFVKTTDAIYVLIIDSGGQFIRRIEWNEKSEIAINEFISDLRNEKSSNEFSNQLYKKLIGNLFESGKVPQHLIIIPDAELNNIPFESLVTNTNKNSIRYLGDDCTIRYEYCLSFLSTDSARKKNGEEILAFAPTFSLPVAGNPTNLIADASKNLLEEQPALRSGFGPLKNNVAEVNAINSQFAGKEITGYRATEEEFRKLAGQYGIIHFATHAYANPDNPRLSGIIFRINNQSSVSIENVNFQMNDSILSRDNILHAYEIQNMKLDADLVVLSACETGVGKYQAGEGAMSLARAFKYANCPNAVTSLWKVDDATTKEIMINFYDNLGDGMGKADALTEAKRKFRKEHPKASPFYWAPFILIGDNEPVPLHKKNHTGWWIGAGLLLLIPVTVLLMRKYKRLSPSKAA